MILGTSPGVVGAHEALLSGSLTRGATPTSVPRSVGFTPPAQPPSSASPASSRVGFNVLSSSPSENGNGHTMISGGERVSVVAAGSGVGSLGVMSGSLGGARRRASGELRAPDRSGAVHLSHSHSSPGFAPTHVTGFNVREHESSVHGAPAPVVGFTPPPAMGSASRPEGAVFSVAGAGAGGGLSKSIAALRADLASSSSGIVGEYRDIEATIAVPVVSNAVPARLVSPPSHGRPPRHSHGGSPAGLGYGRRGLASDPGEKHPGVDADGTPGLLSRVPLEALEAEEEAMLFEAQGRHAAFTSPGVVSAFRVAAAAHRGQRRLSGDLVLRHCVETGMILAELGMDSTVVAAGLLHDVLDDSPVSAAELRGVAGAAITGMVQGVSRLSRISQISRDSVRELGPEERQALRAMLIAMTDARVVIVKLADRLHNLATLDRLDPAAARRVAEETLATHVPLASRLGIWRLKAKLEDAAFAWLCPNEHATLRAELEEGEQRAAIMRAIEAVEAAMRDAGLGDVADICGRPKSLHSVFRKMRKKGVSLEEIHDVRALRVIVSTEEECYAALAAVHNVAGWSPVEGKTKDYVRDAKHNGYQSLHTVVRDDATGLCFEIQIRTTAMDRAAEYGLAAHWRYKETPAPGHSGFDAGQEGRSTSVPLEGSADAHRAVDEQVAWARYMLSWQGQLVDDKCRAPETNGGGGAAKAAAAAVAEFCSPCPCPFPVHHPECHNHEDNLCFGCVAPGRPGDGLNDSPLVSADSASAGLSGLLSPSDDDRAAAGGSIGGLDAPNVFVIAVIDSEMHMLEVPRGARLSDVEAVMRAVADFNVPSSVAVNREAVPPGAEVAVQLRMGDLIEVTRGVSSIRGFDLPPASDIEAQRRRLSDQLAMDVSALDLAGDPVRRAAASTPTGFHP